MTLSRLRALPARVHLAGRRLADRVTAEGRERGDVPGWVLVTLMTAGLVTALWLVAGPALQKVFTDAIASVSGPGAP